MPTPRVFVSHSHADDDFTYRLANDLVSRGADIWVDIVDMDRGDFLERINQALASREWMVVVMTPASLQSTWVRREVNAAINLVAMGRMRDVIPVLAKPCNQQDIPPLWATLHLFDATKNYSAALDGLSRSLGLTNGAIHPRFPTSPNTIHRPEASVPPDVMPNELVQLGFAARQVNGVDVIIPPVCAVEAGEFLMGSVPNQDKQAFPMEQPAVRIALPAFQIGQFPVTFAEYACFVRSGHKPPGNWATQSERLDHPVVNVEWHDALAYAMWLSELTGEAWRLPSEAEWEKASRWDAKRKAARIYPWGDNFDSAKCNTAESQIGSTTRVGRYRAGASPCGAQDMAGNVWEWTRTVYAAYPYSAIDGREDLSSDESRVLRGGSWAYGGRFCRGAYRDAVGAPGVPVISLNSLGFRLARTAPIS